MPKSKPVFTLKMTGDLDITDVLVNFLTNPNSWFWDNVLDVINHHVKIAIEKELFDLELNLSEEQMKKAITEVLKNL